MKKKRIWLLVALLFVAAGTYLYFDFRDFLGLTTLPLSTAKKDWGLNEFTPEQFKNGSKKIRASQTVSLIQSGRYLGKDLNFVSSELGPHDGYYNSDEIPDYVLPELNGVHWELVFLPDKNGMIEKIFIRKGCCYHGIFSFFIR